MAAAREPDGIRRWYHHPHGYPKMSSDVSSGSHYYVYTRAYHVEGDERIDLDKAMEVSKNDGKGQEEEIGGVPLEESHELDHLGKGKHEDELSPEGVSAACEIPVRSRPPARRQKKGVNGKRQGGEGCNVEGVGAPGLLSDPGVRFRSQAQLKCGADSLPDISLAHQTRPVAAPVAAGPSRALIEKLDPIFKGSLDLTLILVLNPGLPLVADKPSSDKVVVVSVQNPLSPFLVLEAVKEVVAGEDFGSVRASPA